MARASELRRLVTAGVLGVLLLASAHARSEPDAGEEAAVAPSNTPGDPASLSVPAAAVSFPAADALVMEPAAVAQPDPDAGAGHTKLALPTRRRARASSQDAGPPAMVTRVEATDVGGPVFVPDGHVFDAGAFDAGSADASHDDALADLATAQLAVPEKPDAPKPVAHTAGSEKPHLERPATVIKTILGILVLLALAYLGGHPIVRSWEERLGVSQAIAAGFPFVVLGMVASAPGVGILNDRVLAELSPLLRLFLGWMGFVYGLRFDIRLFHGLPAGTGRLVVLSTLLPFSMVLGASSLLLAAVASEPLSLASPTFARDALILGTAAAMTARGTARLLRSGEAPGYAARVIRLEELAGMLGLAFVASFFRPSGTDVTWQLPGTAWFLLTVGLGATMGVLAYAILQSSSRDGSKGPGFLVAALGSICFSSGLAAYLHLSSVVVAFIAGALLANLPGDYHAHLRDTLRRLEKPILLMSLVVVGALWRISDWRGWLLMPVFVGARLGGKWLATSPWVLGRDSAPLPREDRYMLGFAPLGTLAIAIVISAQLLYPGGSIPLIVSAVLGGGVLTEIFVQWSSRRRGRPTAEIATETEAARETVT